MDVGWKQTNLSLSQETSTFVFNLSNFNSRGSNFRSVVGGLFIVDNRMGSIQIFCKNVGESVWWLTGINQKYTYEQVRFDRITC